MSVKRIDPDAHRPRWRTVSVAQAALMIAKERKLPPERILHALERCIGAPGADDLVCLFPLDKNSDHTLSYVLAVRYGVTYYGYLMAVAGAHVVVKLIPDDATLGTPNLRWFAFVSIHNVPSEPGPEPIMRWPYPV